MSKRTVLNRYMPGGGGSNSSQTNPALASSANGSDVFNDADSAGQIWGGPNGGAGNTLCSLFNPVQDILFEGLSYYCTQSSSDLGSGVKMGIYDLVTGDVIAETLTTVVQVGKIFLPFVSPVTLERHKGYYKAISCNENGAQFLVSTGKWGGAGSPTLAFEIANAMIPPNALAFYSNKRTFHYAIGVF